MVDDVIYHDCPNPVCKVNETGLCVDNLPVDECPHYTSFEGEEGAVDEEPISRDDDNEKVHTASSVHSAETLRGLECNSELCASAAKVIAVIGPVEAGKTSLIAEIYDALNYSNRYDSLKFAGSLSLKAFERLCHTIRMQSMLDHAAIERTERSGEAFYYHLSLHCNERDETQTFLLADRSGELYEELNNVRVLPADFPELVHASSINVLIDGAAVIDPVRRNAAITSCRQMMTMLSGGKIVKDGVPVNLILTKSDLVTGSEDESLIREAIKKLIQDVKRRGKDCFGEISLLEIAALPTLETRTRGYGVEPLVRAWFENAPVANSYVSKPIVASRMMGCLAVDPKASR